MEKNKKSLSFGAKEVLDTLSAKERRMIQKSYPLKRDRDEAIRALKAKGVTAAILSEITGFCPVYISAITKGYKGEAKADNNNQENKCE
jgi:hypothetical protein